MAINEHLAHLATCDNETSLTTIDGKPTPAIGLKVLTSGPVWWRPGPDASPARFSASLGLADQAGDLFVDDLLCPFGVRLGLEVLVLLTKIPRAGETVAGRAKHTRQFAELRRTRPSRGRAPGGHDG
ncbi:hypothetical protein [Streptosporangium sp. LJ11]|uniref:hypothetical protein n=1 Tax=Streptosporangium sp. LJ11 TaxID=3436927 RepID=UPI003F7A8C8D